MCAPLSNVQALTLAEVANDPVSLAATLAASPFASVIQLQWSGTAHELWDLLSAVAPPGDEEEAGGWPRVRRINLKLDCDVAVFDSEAAEECVSVPTGAVLPR
jgi:hypothetical protein